MQSINQSINQSSKQGRGSKRIMEKKKKNKRNKKSSFSIMIIRMTSENWALTKREAGQNPPRVVAQIEEEEQREIESN
jgi:hypothetical protein